MVQSERDGNDNGISSPLNSLEKEEEIDPINTKMDRNIQMALSGGLLSIGAVRASDWTLSIRQLIQTTSQRAILGGIVAGGLYFVMDQLIITSSSSSSSSSSSQPSLKKNQQQASTKITSSNPQIPINDPSAIARTAAMGGLFGVCESFWTRSKITGERVVPPSSKIAINAFRRGALFGGLTLCMPPIMYLVFLSKDVPSPALSTSSKK